MPPLCSCCKGRRLIPCPECEITVKAEDVPPVVEHDHDGCDECTPVDRLTAAVLEKGRVRGALDLLRGIVVSDEADKLVTEARRNLGLLMQFLDNETAVALEVLRGKAL